MALWNQTLKFSSIVDCGVDIPFPLFSRQLIDHHAHGQFHGHGRGHVLQLAM